MKIDYWADFTCPFSYIGTRNLQQALKNLEIDADLTMHPYELNPAMEKGRYETTIQQLMEKDGLSHEEACRKIDEVQDYAARSSLPMNFENDHFCNTSDAHQLVQYAQKQEKEKAEDLVSALFGANFVDGNNLSDPAVLLACCQKAGIDATAASNVLLQQQFVQDIAEEENKADEIGIESIPYFIINGKVVDSSHSPEDFEAILRNLI